MATRPTLRVDDPEHMTLLGLLLKGFLERQLNDPAVSDKAAHLRGEYVLAAGRMAVTIAFTGDSIEIRKLPRGKPRARIGGAMDALVGLVSGGGLLAAVAAVLRGRIKIGGNPFALLALLPIMLAKPYAHAATRADGSRASA